MTQFQVIKIVGKLHEEITKWHSQKFEKNSPVTPLKKLEGLNESTQHTRVIRLHRALLLHSGDQHVSLSGKKMITMHPLLTCCAARNYVGISRDVTAAAAQWYPSLEKIAGFFNGG
jgi:hypothetical protein